MPSPIIGGIGASLVGGLAQGSAARSAARSQEAAARDNIAFQTETRDLIREDMGPFRDEGINALRTLSYELGLGPRPTFGGQAPQITTLPGGPMGGQPQMPFFNEFSDRGREDAQAWSAANPTTGGVAPDRFSVGGQVFDTREAAEAFAAANPTGGQEYRGFQATPGYQFMQDEGRRAVDASAAARGMLRSGATLQAQQDRAMNVGNLEYGNYLNRISGLASSGQNASAGLAAANQNTANAVGSALGDIGNAQAARAIGVGNAITGALDNSLGVFQYQNMLNRFPMGGVTK